MTVDWWYFIPAIIAVPLVAFIYLWPDKGVEMSIKRDVNQGGRVKPADPSCAVCGHQAHGKACIYCDANTLGPCPYYSPAKP